MISPKDYCSLAEVPDDFVYDRAGVHGYAALPAGLLAAEQSVAPADAFGLNKILCRTLMEHFSLASVPWIWPDQFHSLYQQQLQRIERQLINEPADYFSFSNDRFRKDLGILLHRLIPFGAELATPFSGIARSLVLKAGWRQAGKFVRVITSCRGVKPFLELHMHPKHIAAFNPEGWMGTYENLADFLAVNPALLGVQSTSWFLDPALEQVSPHLAYLRRVPEQCGAIILYAGEDNDKQSGAFATSQTRRTLHAAGRYQPRLFTRIWPRQNLLQRGWRPS